MENNENTQVEAQGASEAAAQNVAVMENHLQVTNLVKILFTISFPLLRDIVNNTPEQLKNTRHFATLLATAKYYQEVLAIYSNAQAEETSGNVETATQSDVATSQS